MAAGSCTCSIAREEFIENSQRYQANLVRYATQCFRRGKWSTTTGIYQFMFTEDWPSITGAFDCRLAVAQERQ